MTGTTTTTKIHMKTYGNGEPLVIIHGFPGNAQDWYAIAQIFGETYRVYVPDLLGFGRSAHPTTYDELSIKAQAAALLAELDRRGIAQFAVIGHDYGMPVAVTLAVLASERVNGLVLSAGNVFRDPPLQPPMRLLPVPILGSAVESALFSAPAIRWLGKNGTKQNGRLPIINTPEEVKSIRAIFATSLRDLELSFGPVEDALPRVTAPTLVVWGAADPFFPVEHARRVSTAIPNSRLALYPGVGHFPYLEDPERFIADTLSFLAETQSELT